MYKLRSRILLRDGRLGHKPIIEALKSRKYEMTNALFAALAASLIIMTAPATAQEKPSAPAPYGGINANIDWTKLRTLEDCSTYDGGISHYRNQADSDLAFGLEDPLRRSALQTAAFDLTSDYGSSTTFAVEKPFGDGNNMLFREAGYARSHLNPVVMADTVKNSPGWRFEGGYERSLNDRLSLRLSREYTAYGNEFDQWQTKAGLLAKF